VFTLYVVLLASFLTSCHRGDLRQAASVQCGEIERAIDLSHPIQALNLISDAFAHRCHAVVLTYAPQIQAEFRLKMFSLVNETASVFLPDGLLTEYVLESYERGYLTVLLAATYVAVGQPDDARVELRRLDHELFTPLYNYGEDPVNLLLSAILWERLGESGEARVDWLRLRDLKSVLTGDELPIRAFADHQVSRLDDAGSAQVSWQVHTGGVFPSVHWDLQFLGSTNGYFLVTPESAFDRACVSETGLRISTRSWFEKIATRHAHRYHPLLNVQSWIRLPVGMVYSLMPVAAGAGIAVGGCALDVAISGKSHGGGALCQVSIQGGIVLASQAPKVLKGSLEPDLRHWERVPAVLVMTTAPSPSDEPCARGPWPLAAF
jgi:hypothetical protein